MWLDSDHVSSALQVAELSDREMEEKTRAERELQKNRRLIREQTTYIWPKSEGNGKNLKPKRQKPT